jgi:hypothetical protein
MSRSSVRAFVVVAGAVVLGGCIVENNSPPADTEIEFSEVQNLGYTCGGPLTSWTVANRETKEQASAACQQPILFQHLSPNATYTFDISGFSGSQLCWQGSCQVVAVGGTQTLADCSSSITHLCGN